MGSELIDEVVVVWRSLAGNLVVEITCAAVPDMLSAVHASGISLYAIEIMDELHIRASICHKDLQHLCSLAQKQGANVVIVRRIGAYWTLLSGRNRPVLLAGVFLVLLLSFFLPTRILFFDVQGNTVIPTNMILEAAQECGLYFGASREQVRSEVTKNMLLTKINGLQWVGVNTCGCVATIHVKERETASEEQEKNGVGRIIAKRDGIISEITVTKGNTQCKVGQAVKSGQTLVSGYTDTGIAIKAEMPQAEIFATTSRSNTLCTPTHFNKRTRQKVESTQYYLRFGKNIIKFCKDSGISDASCVKMYEEKNLKLPGGFLLPVSLIKVQIHDYELTQEVVSDRESYGWISSRAREYLNDHMVSGRIVGSKEAFQILNGLCLLEGTYICTEMIGQVQSEEIVVGNGERN